VFFNKKDIWSNKWNDFVLKVQQKRNAIHAFKDKEIGTFLEFHQCIKDYLLLLHEINSILPYPDDIYVSNEV